jgi:hypothetical protein
MRVLTALIVAVSAVISVAGLATWAGLVPLDLRDVRIRPHRKPAGRTIRWAAAGVAVAALTLLGSEIAAGVGQERAHPVKPIIVHKVSVRFTIPAHQQPGGAQPVIGCGRQPVQLSGPPPANDSVLVASRSAEGTRMQVESDPRWNSVAQRWDAVITVSDTWHPGTWQLTAYVVPQPWVSYMLTAADHDSPNTWWWANTAPPGNPEQDEITVQLDRTECP